MIRVIELFAGIGACSSALDRLGIEHEIVDAVEIDKYAIASFNAIHGTKFEVQDICKWDKDVGEIDLIMHGSPCQDFSVAGKQAGGDEGSGTRSSLMYETLRIVRKVRPRYVIWENVKNLVSKKHKHNFDRYIEEMEKIGYRSYWKVLNAKDYGVSQNRERVFTVSIRNDANGDFEFPKEQELKARLKDVLEESVEEKYYLSDKMVKYFLSEGTGKYPRRERFLQNINRGNQDISNAVTSRAGSRPTDNFVIDVTVQEPKVINPLKGKTNYSWQFEQQVYDAEGIARSVKVGEDSGNIPKVVVVGAYGREYGSNYMTNKRQPLIIASTQAHAAINEDGVSPTLTRAMGAGGGNVPIIVDSSVKPSVAKNFEREKEEIMNSDKEIYQCECESGYQDNKVGLKVSPTIRESSSATYGMDSEYRIRKLTPREAWRLMGFTDAEFEKAKYKKETIFLEGSNEICNAKLKVAKEKQEQSNMETYVLCTTKDLLELGATSAEWLKNLNKQEQEKIQNVNFAIEKWERQEHLECATSTIKCIDYMGMHFILTQEKDPQAMVIIAQVKGVKGNTERYMKITTELNLNPIKLCIILTLIAQIIELKIFSSTTLKANIQGYIVSIEDYESNILLKNLNLEMDIMSERTSNTNLYKQAGNSIVVNVLEGILKNLFTKEGEE